MDLLKDLHIKDNQQAQSSIAEEQFAAVQLVRKLLSEKNPTDMFIASGIVPVLVNCLQQPVLQFEAAWALRHIASGDEEHIRTMVNSGAVPLLIQLFHSPMSHACEQAVWALRYITADDCGCKDVLSQGIIEPLLALINLNTAVPFLRNVASILCNLCRFKNPPPPFEFVCKSLPALVQLVQHEDVDVKVDVCWALSSIAEKDIQIEVVVESKVIPHLVPLLANNDNQVIMAALRTLANIVSGNDEQTQAVLDAGVLPHLLKLMSHTQPSIVQEAVWTVSNIVAGNRHQVQMVIDANLVPAIIVLLARRELRIWKEAAWTISNITTCGTQEQVSYLISQMDIPAMCNRLHCHEDSIIQVILDGLANMLKMAGPDVQFITTAIEEAGGFCTMDDLKSHMNKDICHLAYTIIAFKP